MPELPEVYTISKELDTEIKGKKFQSVKINVAKMVKGNSAKIKNTKIKGVSRRAKLILMKMDNGLNLAIHLKLTGQLFFLPRGKEKTKYDEGINKFTHVIFDFSDGSRLIFNDLRKFGWVKILTDEELEKELEKENYGPEPLESGFTLAKFKEVLARKSNSQIKPLLMDQKFVAGIGNLYSDEILFYAKVHPRRKVKDLSDNEIAKIYQGMKKILKEAIKYHGSSIDTYREVNGKKGTFEFHRKVYRREGEKCDGCKGKVGRIKIGSRSSYFCPECQK